MRAKLIELHSLTTGKILIGTAVAIFIALMIGVFAGNVRIGFDENNFGTFASVLLLALTAWANFRIHSIRKSETDNKWADPRNIWALIGAGFVFLCFDEAMQLHEKIDSIIHKLGGITETSMTDRIDDFLILAYGLVGLALLYVCRKEIVRIPGFVPFLAAGFLLLVVHVGFDTLNLKTEEYVEIYGMTKDKAQLLRQWGIVLEESTKLVAEGVLLAGFTHALRYVMSTSGNAPD